MIFSDDSDFRKAKRALMITSSIALLMVVTGLPLEKIDFGVVTFDLDESRGVYWFLLAVLAYQLSTFLLRHTGDKLNKELTSSEEAHKYLKEKGSIKNIEEELKQLREHHSKLSTKFSGVLARNNIDWERSYIWEGKTTVNKYLKIVESSDKEVIRRTYTDMDNTEQMLSSAANVVGIQLKTNKNQSYQHIIDYKIPLLYSVVSLLSLLVYLVFF